MNFVDKSQKLASEPENEVPEEEIKQPQKVIESVSKPESYYCATCKTVIKKVLIVRPCMCLTCTECTDIIDSKCSKCCKRVNNYHQSQEVQGYFNNLNYMLEMASKSDILIKDLEKSNSSMHEFNHGIMNPQEETKIISERPPVNPDIRVGPQMSNKNQRQPNFKSTSEGNKYCCLVCGEFSKLKFSKYSSPGITNNSLHGSKYQQDLLNLYCLSNGLHMDRLFRKICKMLDKGQIQVSLSVLRRYGNTSYSKETGNMMFTKDMRVCSD